MNRILKKLKGLGGSVLGGLLSLIFTNGAKAQSMPVPLYGIQPPHREKYYQDFFLLLGVYFLFL